MTKQYILFSIVLILSAGCMHRSTQDQAEKHEVQASAVAKSEPQEPPKTTEQQNADAHQTVTVTTTTTAATHHKVEGVEPEVAMRWLKNGNTRFVKGYLRNDGQSKKDVERLSTGQKPHTIVLSCSDSRVPPEIVFDQKLGEIFVVRTAGEVLDPGSIASIEYAVEHLGARNLLVMGHTQCGAVKAAFSTMDGKDAGSDNLNKLVADIHPRIAPFKGHMPSKDYAEEGWANVNGVMADLQRRSKIINERAKNHDIQSSGSLYHLDSGMVEFK